ncbi:MAG: hypothetical protein JJU36_05610 [Phycisphaeraceae bacterium]|nr:hypothetical protein [Phycisphaeraceae bacterium]
MKEMQVPLRTGQFARSAALVSVISLSLAAQAMAASDSGALVMLPRGGQAMACTGQDGSRWGQWMLRLAERSLGDSEKLQWRPQLCHWSLPTLAPGKTAFAGEHAHRRGGSVALPAQPSRLPLPPPFLG